MADKLNALAKAPVNALSNLYNLYQRRVGQPFQQAVRGGVRGYFGLPLMSDADPTGREAYRQGEALGYTPGVGAPAGAAKTITAAAMPLLPAFAKITKNLTKAPEPNFYDFVGKDGRKYLIYVDQEAGKIQTLSAKDYKIVGELDAAPVKGYTLSKENESIPAWMGVDKNHRRNNINTAMNAVALENIPGYSINADLFTTEGKAWYDAVTSKTK